MLFSIWFCQIGFYKLIQKSWLCRMKNCKIKPEYWDFTRVTGEQVWNVESNPGTVLEPGIKPRMSTQRSFGGGAGGKEERGWNNACSCDFLVSCIGVTKHTVRSTPYFPNQLKTGTYVSNLLPSLTPIVIVKPTTATQVLTNPSVKLANLA